MPIQGAIFDLDGTLLDSMEHWQTIARDYLRSVGVTPRPGVDRTVQDMSLSQAAHHLKKEYALPYTPEEIMSSVNRIVEGIYRETVQPKPGVPGFLRRLRAAGVPMCVATATDRYLVEAALTRCGLLDFFGAIFPCTEVGHGKDEPDVYEAALAFLGTPRGDTWVFEDALYAARTAKAAGFPLVGVADKSEPQGDVLRQLAQVYVTDLNQAEACLFPPSP